MNKSSVIKRCPEKFQDDRPKDQQRWCLFTHDGDKVLGRHPSKEKAEAQERAVQSHKHSSVEQIVDNIVKESFIY